MRLEIELGWYSFFYWKMMKYEHWRRHRTKYKYALPGLLLVDAVALSSLVGMGGLNKAEIMAITWGVKLSKNAFLGPLLALENLFCSLTNVEGRRPPRTLLVDLLPFSGLEGMGGLNKAEIMAIRWGIKLSKN